MLLYVFIDIQQLIELGAALEKHCAANDSSYMPKVGEPCCGMCPGETPVFEAVILTKELLCVYEFCCTCVPLAR